MGSLSTGYFTDEYLERIKEPLEEIDFIMRMDFEGLDSGDRLPYIYEDEFNLHKRLWEEEEKSRVSSYFRL